MATNTRLTADDWLQAGYAIVAEEGLNALKLDRLCTRLRVTKGSFCSMASLVRPRQWSLERAMREWARSDETVAAALRSADRRLLNAVREAFRDFGFDADEADLRANTAFAAGVGLLHLAGPSPKKLLHHEKFLDFLLRT